jgi:hypothetical protein
MILHTLLHPVAGIFYNFYTSLCISFPLYAPQTIVKKASAMLDGNSSIHRCHRLYYAYLSRNSSSWGPGSSAGTFFC